MTKTEELEDLRQYNEELRASFRDPIHGKDNMRAYLISINYLLPDGRPAPDCEDAFGPNWANNIFSK